MALVPAAPPAYNPTSETPGAAIVQYDAHSVGQPLEHKLAVLRAEREAHRHKQIWTKDAHGGPYQKVTRSAGAREAEGPGPSPAAGRCCRFAVFPAAVS